MGRRPAASGSRLATTNAAVPVRKTSRLHETGFGTHGEGRVYRGYKLNLPPRPSVATVEGMDHRPGDSADHRAGIRDLLAGPPCRDHAGTVFPGVRRIRCRRSAIAWS